MPQFGRVDKAVLFLVEDFEPLYKLVYAGCVSVLVNCVPDRHKLFERYSGFWEQEQRK